MTTAPLPRLLGAVLAGGASSRFGNPKWRVPVAGEVMGARAVAALAPCSTRVVAIAGDSQVASLGVEVRADLTAGQGPLGGILTALSWARELALDGALVLACDLPLVSARLLRELISAWHGEAAVVPAGPDGLEPLCALYAAASLPAIEDALARGELSPSRLLQVLDFQQLPLERARRAAGVDHPFLNVNTRETWALAEELLRGSGVRLARSGGPCHM